MRKITIETSSKYDVLIGNGILEKAGEHLQEVLKCDKLCIVSDETVYGLYGQELFEALENADYKVCVFTVPAGEDSKNMDTVSKLLEFMAKEQLTRVDAIVAFGGGVIGDLAGFVAACYLRGISFVQIPTTLLAAVDSSVGGKTGVNLSHGKNLAGAFWQPSLVFCDTHLFKSLSQTILLDGIAEIIKYGVIADKELFEFMFVNDFRTLIESNGLTCKRSATKINRTENNSTPDKMRIESIVDIVARCVKIKAEIVSQDERDTGKRMLLNFGHTLGHAIEKCSNYEISHGHAVAIGMRYISHIATIMEILRPNDTVRIAKILKKYNFSLTCDYSAKELYEAALVDKKRAGNTITEVFPNKIGSCRLEQVDIFSFEELIKEALSSVEKE